MEDYTGMFIKILIVVVVGSTILGLVNAFVPELWEQIADAIKNMFSSAFSS